MFDAENCVKLASGALLLLFSATISIFYPYSSEESKSYL